MLLMKTTKQSIWSRILPGGFDQRANSLAECLQIISGEQDQQQKTAKIYILKGKITNEQEEKIKKYIINSVDSRIATLEKLTKAKEETQEPKGCRNNRRIYKHDR